MVKARLADAAARSAVCFPQARAWVRGYPQAENSFRALKRDGGMVGPGTAQRNGVMQVKAFGEVTAKVAAAEDLSATLAVGWEAFQFIAIAADYYAGRTSTSFATWMSALAPACEGRDRLGSAPSIPEDPAPQVAQPDLGLVTEDDAASGLARLVQELIRRLQAAASSATMPEDSLACKRAAESAAEIYRLFASDT